MAAAIASPESTGLKVGADGAGGIGRCVGALLPGGRCATGAAAPGLGMEGAATGAA